MGNKASNDLIGDNKLSPKQNLRRHVQNQSANQCDQCSVGFCDADALKGHVFSARGVKFVERIMDI